ncbi:MAG: DUF5946 family protein [Acidimicrobiales bacterium]
MWVGLEVGKEEHLAEVPGNGGELPGVTDTGPTTACSGCGALVADIDGPTHVYILSAPGCWQLYGEILAAEFADPARWPAHQLSVDAYAVGHPNNRDRRNRQSVALHLVSLCLLVERQLPPERAPKFRAALLEAHRASGFPSLDPLPGPAAITVVDAAGAPTPGEHIRRVQRWAASAWQAWDQHQDQVRAWADEIFPLGT